MFRVEWFQVALDELMSLWLQADATQRTALTAASHLIDQRLSSDPRNEGESRGEGQRITFAPPLAVRFQIEADGRTVTVLQVRLFGRRQR